MLWIDPCGGDLLGLPASQGIGRAGDTKQMAKRQTRRSISVKGITYQRLKDFCEGQGVSVSGYLEEIIAEKLDAAGAPVPEKVEPRPRPKAVDAEEIVSQHFTF